MSRLPPPIESMDSPIRPEHYQVDYTRPSIEKVVKRWGKVDRDPGAPCSIPFGFLTNLERYIHRLEDENNALKGRLES